jgi:hypothetical protein
MNPAVHARMLAATPATHFSQPHHVQYRSGPSLAGLMAPVPGAPGPAGSADMPGNVRVTRSLTARLSQSDGAEEEPSEVRSRRAWI